MSQEDKKVVKIFTVQGLGLDIVTRMPWKEIQEEVRGGEGHHPQYIELIGLNESGNTVDVHILREYLAAYLIAPFNQSQIAIPKLALQ